MIIQNLTICKNKNLETRKLARYIFPKNDLGPNLAGQISFTPAQCLEFGVNLCLHRLPKDLKEIWDELAGRDSIIPEISKSGIQSTKYDLRMRGTAYKKEREKRDYIKDLKYDIRQKEFESTDSLPLSKQECKAKAKAIARMGPEKANWAETVNISRCQLAVTQKGINISESEENGEASKIINKFLMDTKEHQNKQSILFKMYFNEKNSFLEILESINKYDLTRKIKNKIKHFTFLLGKTVISLGKLRYYIRLMNKCLKNIKGGKDRHDKTLKIKNLGYSENLVENRLPEIFLNFPSDATNQLVPGLCDSGAQSSVIGHEQLINLGFKDSQIQKSDNYNIQSSTEIVTDAIIGKIKIKIFCLIRTHDQKDEGEFGMVTQQFLVAHKKIKLTKLILGIDFMHHNAIKLNFGRKKCDIRATIKTQTGRRQVYLELNNENSQLFLDNKQDIKVQILPVAL
jgi:hypothetical protein